MGEDELKASLDDGENDLDEDEDHMTDEQVDELMSDALEDAKELEVLVRSAWDALEGAMGSANGIIEAFGDDGWEAIWPAAKLARLADEAIFQLVKASDAVKEAGEAIRDLDMPALADSLQEWWKRHKRAAGAAKED
jgi:hypothetical protein